MAEPKSGSGIMILVKNGEEFVPCAFTTGHSWDSETEMIDVTSKDEKHKKYIHGKHDGTAEQEGFYVPSDVAYQLLKSAKVNDDFVYLRRDEDGTSVEEVEALITTMAGDAPDGDGSTMSISYQLNGDWEVVA